MVFHLKHQSKSIVIQAVWCLANITGFKNTEYKESILKTDIGKTLNQVFEKWDNGFSGELFAEMVWLCNNLTRQPTPSKEFLT